MAARQLRWILFGEVLGYLFWGMSLFNPPYGALFERLTKFLIR